MSSKLALRASRTFFEAVRTFIPSRIGVTQEATRLGWPSTSTTQIRHPPQGVRPSM